MKPNILRRIIIIVIAFCIAAIIPIIILIHSEVAYNQMPLAISYRVFFNNYFQTTFYESFILDSAIFVVCYFLIAKIFDKIDDIKNQKVRAEQIRHIQEMERLEDERIRHESERLNSNIAQASKLIATGRYDEAISNLESIKDEADQLKFSEISSSATRYIRDAKNKKQEELDRLKQERIRQETERLNSNIEEASKLIDMGRYDEAITNLESIKDEANQLNISGISASAVKNIKRAQTEKIRPQITTAIHLIESENFDEAIANLEKCNNEADRKNLYEISSLASKYIQEAKTKKQEKIDQLEKERKQSEFERLNPFIEQASLLIHSGKYDEAIDSLMKLKDEAEQKNVPRISDLAIKYLSEARSEKLKHNIQQASQLIVKDDYDGAIADLEKSRDESNKYGFSEISSLATESIKQAQMFKTFVKMFKISNKLKIDDICEQLERPRKEMLSIFFDWGDKFNVKIEGDFVIVENSAEINPMMSNLLDRTFKEWTEKEKTKEGKI